MIIDLSSKAGAKRSINLEGQTIGQWTILKEVQSVIYTYKNVRNTRRYYLCQCSCGRQYTVSLQALKDKVSTRCRDCGSKPKLGRYSNTNEIAAGKLCLIRSRHNAKQRKLSFELDLNTCINLANAGCNYCGKKYVNGARRSECRIVKYNGIDRVDNTRGYTKDNVVSCCGKCNRMKMDSSLEEFKEQIRLIYATLNLGANNG